VEKAKEENKRQANNNSFFILMDSFKFIKDPRPRSLESGLKKFKGIIFKEVD
tara:strand:+ start:224 stop:379 length:156 start_codon:yes stop_codon:yes gene_type:complete